MMVVVVVSAGRDSCTLYNGLIVRLEEGCLLRAIWIVKAPRVCDFEIGAQVLRDLCLGSGCVHVVVVLDLEGGTRRTVNGERCLMVWFHLL